MSEQRNPDPVVVGSIGVNQEGHKPAARKASQAAAPPVSGGRKRQPVTTSQAQPSISIPRGSLCLITVGAATAGKSVLQHALIHRLWKDKDVYFDFWDAQPDLPQTQKKDGVLKEWLTKFDDGELPQRTPRGKFETFSIEFGEVNKKNPVKLSFVEISGEHFTDILPDSDSPDHQPKLAPQLEQLFSDRNIEKYFIFVADTARHLDGDSNMQQDMLFDRVLKELMRFRPRRTLVLFVAAKWDLIYNKSLEPEQFFDEYFRNSMDTVGHFGKVESKCVRFTIGRVETPDDGSGNPKIVEYEPYWIRWVIQWIYNNKTNRRLPRPYPRTNETWWEWLMRMAAG